MNLFVSFSLAATVYRSSIFLQIQKSAFPRNRIDHADFAKFPAAARLDRDRRFDRRMRLVAEELEVFEREVADIFDPRIQFHPRQRPALASQLFARPVEVVVVKMQVAKRMHEIARRKIYNLRDHHREQRVTGDVERHTEKQIAAALIELAAQLAIVRVKLEEHVAWRQRHLLDFP